jgi:hypothetical protein
MTVPTSINSNLTGGGASPYGIGEYNPVSLASPTAGTASALSTPMTPGGSGGSSIAPSVAGGSGGASVSGQVDNAAASDSGGFDWSQILSGLGSIIGSPLVSSGALIGLGESAAAQQQSQTAGLTSQLTTPAKPFVQGGVSELQAAQQGLSGKPVTTGSIGQQEATAANLGNVAQQYSTGQLTSAQQLQVQQQAQAQKQQIAQQLASQGITDSSVIDMYNQQVDNNTAILTQQLTTQNIGIAAQAQAAVQQTYSSLISDAISQFGAGMGPIEDAVNLTIQQNTQIAASLQNLFGQIARGFSGATAGGASATSGISSGANTLANQLGKLTGNSGSDSLGAATSDVNSSTALDLSNIDSEIGLDNETYLAEQGVQSDVESSLATDLADDLPFSSAGGAAATGTGAASAAGGADVASSLAGFPAASAGIGTDAAVAPALGTAATDAGGAGAAAGSAGAGGASAAGLGALAGGALAVGGVLAPLAAGLLTQPYTLDASYWSRLNNAVAAGPGQSAQGNINYLNALREIQGNPSMASAGEWQALAKYGITPDNLDQAIASASAMQPALVGGQGGSGKDL